MKDIKDLTDKELYDLTGFEVYEFPPDSDPCELCGAKHKQLYYRSFDGGEEGEYSCRECVVEIAQMILDWRNGKL